MLRDIHRLLEQRQFETIDEANTFLSGLIGSGMEDSLAEAGPPSAQEEAQDLAYGAMEASTKARAIALARQALAKDPDCVDAIVTLTMATERSAEGAIAGLERAVAAGERSLGPQFFEENKGHFWGILETRPYMRARYELADLLWEQGREEEAIGHLEALLELNPNDNQGVRDTLLGEYLTTNNLGGARRLLAQYGKDGSAVFQWGRVLERIFTGDFSGAKRALKRAREANRFVELFVTGEKLFPPDSPELYSFGSEEEAVICLEALGEACANHPEGMVWLVCALQGLFLTDEGPTAQAKLEF
jgi:tetratricopeptide (TPR) repeat protein